MKMTEWRIEVDPSIVESLAESFRQGPVISVEDGVVKRMFTEALVEKLNGVKVEISQMNIRHLIFTLSIRIVTQVIEYLTVHGSMEPESSGL